MVQWKTIVLQFHWECFQVQNQFYYLLQYFTNMKLEQRNFRKSYEKRDFYRRNKKKTKIFMNKMSRRIVDCLVRKGKVEDHDSALQAMPYNVLL